MKTYFFFFFVFFLVMSGNAQIINGDRNHNDVLDVNDVTLLIDDFLSENVEMINTDYYAVQNDMVVGTWYRSSTECLDLRADGTTNYAKGYTYQFLPSLGRILFFNAQKRPVASMNVVYIAEDFLAILPAGSDIPVVYTAMADSNLFDLPVPEFVDLGLSVKWATMNIGASVPEDFGDYYAWGETTSKFDYSDSTYGWCKCRTESKSNNSEENQDVLDLSNDAAYRNGSVSCRIPTYEEWDELITQCTWTWTALNGVNGYNVTGTNGNSIFLPAGGQRDGISLNDAGEIGFYWSSTKAPIPPNYAYNVILFPTNVDQNRCPIVTGQTIRAVYRKVGPLPFTW